MAQSPATTISFNTCRAPNAVMPTALVEPIHPFRILPGTLPTSVQHPVVVSFPCSYFTGHRSPTNPVRPVSAEIQLVHVSTKHARKVCVYVNGIYIYIFINIIMGR